MNHRNATSAQFERVILRLMPNCFSAMAEGKLIAGIYAQAFLDGHLELSRRFFLDDNGGNAYYASLVGLEPTQIRTLYKDHCKAYKTHMMEIAA